jgi:hypothetical protein
MKNIQNPNFHLYQPDKYGKTLKVKISVLVKEYVM